MARRYYMMQRREASRLSVLNATGAIDGQGSAQDGACAGGHRVSGGAPGNGPGRSTALIDFVTGPHDEWEESEVSLRPEQLNWLSPVCLVSILQGLCCDIEGLHMTFSDKAYGEKLDADSVHDFFLDDYMRCVLLVNELDYRLNKL